MVERKMKLVLTALIIIGLLVISGCYQQPNIEKIAKDWEAVGYVKGINKGIEVCENNYKPMLEQYRPREGCIILILDNYSMRYICEGDKYYNELVNNE